MSRTESLHLADLCSLAYLLFSVALVVFYRAPAWPLRGVLYVAAAAAIPLLARRAAAGDRPWRVAAALYPVVLVALAWGELRVLIPLPWAGSYWGTGVIVRGDAWLFGGHPTVLIRAWHRPWLDELMAAVYLTYYAFLALPLVLVLRGRIRAARATASLVILTYGVNFAFFVLFPVKSPPQLVGDVPGMVASGFHGWVAAATLRALQGRNMITGAAFPSSHVAGAFVCALAARRWLPGLGRVLVPLAAGVGFATVYLGYHHALDPITGMLWGAAAYAIGLSLLRRRGELPAGAGTGPTSPREATSEP